MRELRVDVRGGGRFVLRPVDEAYVMGSDGTDYWLTRQDGPVWVTSDSRSLVPKLRRTMTNTWLFGIASSPNEPLLLDMAGVLSLIERRHDVELIDSASSCRASRTSHVETWSTKYPRMLQKGLISGRTPRAGSDCEPK